MYEYEKKVLLPQILEIEFRRVWLPLPDSHRWCLPNLLIQESFEKFPDK